MRPDSEFALAKRLNDFPGVQAAGSPTHVLGPTTQSLKFNAELNVNPLSPTRISGPAPDGEPTSRYPRTLIADCAVEFVLPTGTHAIANRKATTGRRRVGICTPSLARSNGRAAARAEVQATFPSRCV